MNGKVVGTSVPRKDGIEKVTGRAPFVADIPVPGCWEGGVVGSPVPHGILKGFERDPAFDWSDLRLVRDAWPREGRIVLRGGPLRALIAVRTYDARGAAHDVDPAGFVLDLAADVIASPPWALPKTRPANRTARCSCAATDPAPALALFPNTPAGGLRRQPPRATLAPCARRRIP